MGRPKIGAQPEKTRFDDGGRARGASYANAHHRPMIVRVPAGRCARVGDGTAVTQSRPSEKFTLRAIFGVIALWGTSWTLYCFFFFLFLQLISKMNILQGKLSDVQAIALSIVFSMWSALGPPLPVPYVVRTGHRDDLSTAISVNVGSLVVKGEKGGGKVD